MLDSPFEYDKRFPEMYPEIDRNSMHPLASYKFILANVDIIPKFVIFFNFLTATLVILILWNITFLPDPFFA